MKVFGIRGTIRRVGDKYVSIYVYAEYSEELAKYVGKRIIGLIAVEDA